MFEPMPFERRLQNLPRALRGGGHGKPALPMYSGRDALRRIRGGIGDAALPYFVAGSMESCGIPVPPSRFADRSDVTTEAKKTSAQPRNCRAERRSPRTT